MNVANLENCKELFELSGWRDTTNTFASNSEKLDWLQSDNGKGWYLPAYDSGYLLRKLPARIESKEHGSGSWLILEKILGAQDGDWVARYGTDYICHQDTPEDALCKLAIELFKQGVLK